MKRFNRGTYPADWSEQARRVKEAAGWRCARCGHPYKPGDERRSGPLTCDDRCTHPQDGKQRVLTVEHITADKSESYAHWWAFIALCQSCHLSVQGRVILERPWVFEHSAWFKPFVAGYYAWRYLGVNLPREEVEARLDELLALEPAAILGAAA